MNTIKSTTLSVFASFIACSVILSGAHAKDVVGMRHFAKDDTVLKTTIKTTDVAQKALSELHNHVDKTSVKSMTKTTTLDTIMSREREAKAEFIRMQNALSVRIMEALFMLRLAIAHAF